MFPFNKFHLFLPIYFTLLYSVHGQDICEIDHPFFGAQLIFYYVPNELEPSQKALALYYHNPKFQLGDIIHVIRHDITHTFLIYPLEKSGYEILPFDELPELNYTTEISTYLPIYAHWRRKKIDGAESYIGTHPTWMYDRKDKLGNRSIVFPLIPGTHNSGSYTFKYPQPFIERVAATQGLSIFDQLVLGVRYLDLRVALLDNIYFIYHSIFYTKTLNMILRDIKRFLDNTTHEIIFLSFKDFSNFGKADHNKFIEHLGNFFEDYIVPRLELGWGTTFNELWNLNKRIIICYDFKIQPQPQHIWPRIMQFWGNVNSLDALKNHLILTEQINYYPRASMAQYTMGSLNILAQVIRGMGVMQFSSLFDMAVEVAPHATSWYNERFYENASIIAMDYIENTGIIDVALSWNDRRLTHCIDDYKFAMKHEEIY